MSKMEFDLIAPVGGTVDLIVACGNPDLQDSYGVGGILKLLNGKIKSGIYDERSIKYMLRGRLRMAGVPNRQFSIQGPYCMPHTI